ncbi:MAG: MATE family efflux transporter [Thermoleophilaceae bacterium]|nr:MATE family efflux transporter [Thermoleophilaceae bacterium]
MEATQPTIAAPATNRQRDRQIFGLALPALGALAAEPLYRLVDTAIVGHLGVAQLGGLAIAITLFGSAFWLFNFLSFGTTARVARLRGAGQTAAAGKLAMQALWMAVAIGIAMIVVGQLLAAPLIQLMGGEGLVAQKAETYLRIALFGSPFVLVVLAGEGYLRGVQDLITPLKILIVANIANVVLEVIFVYGFDWDVAGSAWGTLIAQVGAAAAFVTILVRASAGQLRPAWREMRSLVVIAYQLIVRTGALLLFFNLIVALLARQSAVELAANQVILEMFLFLALTLDALAIAAQSIIGNLLGAGSRAESAAMARRLTLWAFTTGVVLLVVLLVGRNVLPHIFTSSAAVIAAMSTAWVIFALQQPINAVVFGWDGVLGGASDFKFMMLAMVGSSVVASAVAYELVVREEMGVTGAWLAVSVLIGMRFISCGLRVVRGRWMVLGA